MSFELTILGANSALPSSNKFTTSQVLNYNHNYFLIDCGEGTQMQLRANGIKIQSINHIFISHLHGDHFFGLIGLLNTMNLMGRTADLNLFAPKPIQEIINVQLKASGTWLKYPLNFNFLDFTQPQLLTEYKGLHVTSFPVKHRVDCCGFLFKEAPKPRKINKILVEDYKVQISFMKNLTQGEDFVTATGKVVPNAKLTLSPTPIKSYAFCADTKYFEEIFKYVKEVDLLYHEATFLHELIDRANKTAHTTALQAGQVAKQANVGLLLIGHFSARYKEGRELLMEAQSVFKNTQIAEQNHTYKI